VTSNAHADGTAIRGCGEVALPVRAPDADPSTEVGRVAAALNRMLGHVGDALAAPARQRKDESR
jgi:two-component system OmpR family sensor kinase